MATYIAIIRNDREYGYTASFPDFPGCVAKAPALEPVIGKAREALSLHIERLLEANRQICSPTAAEAIVGGGGLLLAAINVPDDLQAAHVELAIPALSLARIDSVAERHGLTRGALFVAAVDRWAGQEGAPTERRRETADARMLFDFGIPLELAVEPVTADIEPERGAARLPGQVGEPVCHPILKTSRQSWFACSSKVVSRSLTPGRGNPRLNRAPER